MYIFCVRAHTAHTHAHAQTHTQTHRDNTEHTGTDTETQTDTDTSTHTHTVPNYHNGGWEKSQPSTDLRAPLTFAT